MSTVPSWIQKENDQKAEAKRKADADLQRQLQAGEFIRLRGPAFWDQLALALHSNAQGLEKLEGEELYGSAPKSVSGGAEHNIYVRVERRSNVYGPEAAWLNLWYTPGSGSIRCWYMHQENPNIELIVSGTRNVGREVHALYDGIPLTADQLAERIIRQMAEQVRAKRQR
jgi:hypothetical protein